MNGQLRKMRPYLDSHGQSWITKESGTLRSHCLPSSTTPNECIEALGTFKSPPHTVGCLCTMEKVLEREPSELKAILTKEQWMLVDSITAKVFWEHAPVTKYLYQHLKLELDGVARTHIEYEEMCDAGTPTVQRHSLPLPVTYCHHGGEVKRDMDAASFDPAAIPRYDTVYVEMAAQKLGLAIEGAVIAALRKDAIQTPPHHPLHLMQIQLERERYYGPYIAAVADRKKWKVKQIVESPQLGYEEAIVFNASPDCVRLVVGLQPTVVQDQDKLKTVCIIVPQVRGGVAWKSGKRS